MQPIFRSRTTSARNTTLASLTQRQSGTPRLPHSAFELSGPVVSQEFLSDDRMVARFLLQDQEQQAD